MPCPRSRDRKPYENYEKRCLEQAGVVENFRTTTPMFPGGKGSCNYMAGHYDYKCAARAPTYLAARTLPACSPSDSTLC